MYFPDTLWSDQNIYMKSLAYPRPSIRLMRTLISSEITHSNAFLHFIPPFGHWGASPVEPSSRFL